MEKKGNSGFSLAELLIVVAIIVILMGVVFVAVQNHQSSMTRLEFDTIAKEIFIAAQNHLAAAESQGYPEDLSFGHEGTKLTGDDITAEVWYVVSGDNDTLKDVMLPDYALDATVLSGTYVIRYQPHPATVLDVFYSKEGESGFLRKSGTRLTDADYGTLMGASPNYRAGGEKNRENYKETGKVIGWYGGGDAVAKGERLKTPTFEIINAEKLLVRVSDPNAHTSGDGYCLKLIVTGKKSGKEVYFSLIQDGSTGSGPRLSSSEANTVILDSITDSGMHFSKIPGSALFPGEDLIVKVVAYSTKVLSNVAMSAEKITNSLFADPSPFTAGNPVRGSDIENGVAGIKNIRHLENLDNTLSDYNPSKLVGTNVTLNQAIQMENLSWADFKQKTDGANTKIDYGSGNTTNNGCFYPVSPGYVLKYSGQSKKISDITVNYGSDAGLFGIPSAGSSVSDLELIDFNITSTNGNAGTLAGTLITCTVSNVLAYNSTGGASVNVTASASAGGLVGSQIGGSLEYSAAAVIVDGGTSAGGLVGTASGTVFGCYSGGHTEDASYYSGGKAVYGDDGKPTNGIYNVTATNGSVGGLIGVFSGTTIDYSYSTCSVSGKTAGGFVGNASGKDTNISSCYCTGLVSGTDAEGAFSGTQSGSYSECLYYGIINERYDDISKKFTYLKALGDNESADIAEFDASAYDYDSFVGTPDEWQDAVVYDSQLTDYYGKGASPDKKSRYNLKTVAQLGAPVPGDGTESEDQTGTDTETQNGTDSGTQSGTANGTGTGTAQQVKYYVTTHYGDWPAPEIFIINTP